ncbi:Hypothetical protein ING2D1G_0486 [Peptoniphilus sp. ING2-D1G]|nr:Hypothetical protein ING2D1G_0486 [Peptoniphilus sp. ING2-D1G]
MRKKLMPLLLAFVMVFSALQTSAFAEVVADSTEPAPAATEAAVEETAQPEAPANTEEVASEVVAEETVTEVAPEEAALEVAPAKVFAQPQMAPVLLQATIPVNSVTITPSNLDMIVGDVKTLSATIDPADATNQNLSWFSNNSSVAEIDNSGVVTAVGPGTATISVTADGGVSDTVNVTVTAASSVVTGIVTTPSTISDIRVGETGRVFTAKVLPTSASQAVTWSSSDPTILSIGQSTGTLTAFKEGTVVITATSVADPTVEATITVVVNPASAPVGTGKIYNVDVYYNKVTGYAPRYSTVKLYKNGVYLGSDTADGAGYFSIANSFGYYGGYYDGGYWYDGKWYDYYDYYNGGYWYDGKWYDYYDYYNGGYRYYDLSGYELQAYDGTTLLDTYYLSSANAHYDYNRYWGWNYYYPDYPNYYSYYNTKVYPTSLSLNYSDDVVNGYLRSYPNTYVSVYRDGTYLGSGYTNGNGYFNISLNRSVSGVGVLDFYIGDRYGTYDESYGNRIYPWSLSTSSYNVSGYYNPNTSVRAYYDGKYIGSDVTDSDGYFSISSSTRIYNDANLKFYSDSSVVSTTTKDTYKTEITIGSGALNKTVNGVTTTTYMDVAAYIKDGRTMLPIRFVAESLGYYVTFNDATRNATFSDGNKVVVLNIDSDEYYVDGVKHTFSVKPEIRSGRTMLPISEIGRALGLTHGNKGEGKNIEWDAVNQKVTISVTKSK